MTIRERVATAIMEACPGMKGHAAINAFLAGAAEPDEDGISWHMRPDEATEEMVGNVRKKLASQLPSNQPEPVDRPWSVTSALIVRKVYDDMLATAPEFKFE